MHSYYEVGKFAVTGFTHNVNILDMLVEHEMYLEENYSEDAIYKQKQSSV